MRIDDTTRLHLESRVLWGRPRVATLPPGGGQGNLAACLHTPPATPPVRLSELTEFSGAVGCVSKAPIYLATLPPGGGQGNLAANILRTGKRREN